MLSLFNVHYVPEGDIGHTPEYANSQGKEHGRDIPLGDVIADGLRWNCGFHICSLPLDYLNVRAS